jgi:hypothetical protein
MMEWRSSAILTRSQCSRNRGGLSLLETLLSLAMLGLAIGLLANLTTEYSRLIRFSGSKDQLLVACRTLEHMAQAVEESTEIVKPGLLEEDAQSLDLQSVQISGDRFTGWSFIPNQPTKLSSFYIQDGHLVGANGKSDPTPNILARDVAGFSVSRPTQNSLDLEISVDDRSNVKTYSLKAHQWVR